MGWKGERSRHSMAARGIKTSYPTIPTNKMSDTMKMQEVFAELENKGILARANFSCCQSCAGYALATLAEEQNKAGYVFWHQQSQQTYLRTGDLYIYYAGADNTQNPPPNGISTLEVAKTFVNILDKYNIKYEWDGTTNQAIVLKGLDL